MQTKSLVQHDLKSEKHSFLSYCSTVNSYKQTQTFPASSSYWKNYLAVLDYYKYTVTHTQTHTAWTPYCASNGSRALRHRFLVSIGVVFVWFHAYWAVMEHSDPHTKGGPLTNRFLCEDAASLWDAVQAIRRRYTVHTGCSLEVMFAER